MIIANIWHLDWGNFGDKNLFNTSQFLQLYFLSFPQITVGAKGIDIDYTSTIGEED